MVVQVIVTVMVVIMFNSGSNFLKISHDFADLGIRIM